MDPDHVMNKRSLPRPAQIMPPHDDVAENDDPDEDVLDRFSDPAKKRKRKEKKDKQDQEKKLKAVNAGKRWANDEFNTPPSPEELEIWRSFVTTPLPTLSDLESLQRDAEHMTVESLGYIPLARTDHFFCVMDCLSAMHHCEAWLNERLARVGWKINTTGYEPRAVSHSTKEILPATLECYRMALKQMILLVQHSSVEEKPKSPSVK